MARSLDHLPIVEPKSREEWRAWLERNYTSCNGIWLVVGKKGGSRTTLTYEEAVEEAVRFNWIDSTVHRGDDQTFNQLFTPRRPGSTWSDSNKQRIERLDAAGLLTPEAIAAVEAAKADGSWNQLVDVDNLVMPDDLAAALDAHPGAREGFDMLTTSQCKMTLFWIQSAKRPETRARRIEKTVSAVVEGRPPYP